MLTFIEATLFTKRIIELGAEETYQALQNELAANPDAGDVIAGMGGLRRFACRYPEGASVARQGRCTCFSRVRKPSSF